jgi:sugar/nucleoside kinase (ribokinase family)
VRFPFNLKPPTVFDAVGFGLNAVDHLIVVPAYPKFDTKVRLLEHTQTAGGQTSTAMVALQRLGLNTAYAGRFGSDAEGQFALQEMKNEGVNIEFAETVAGARNQLAFIIVDANNGERTIIWDRDERVSYREDQAPIALAARGRVLHLDAHDPPACTRMAREARANGTIVSADVDSIYAGLLELLPLVNILISSQEFPQRLSGIADERASLNFKLAMAAVLLGQPKAAVVLWFIAKERLLKRRLLKCRGDAVTRPVRETHSMQASFMVC